MSPKRVCAPPQRRSGIRVRAVGVNKEVRKSVLRFLRWLRCEMSFPIRVPVYLSPKDRIVLKSRKKVPATFFAPDDRNEEPFIRIATGDYDHLKGKRGRDNALAAILCSVAHEIAHYQQWCANKPFREREAETRAIEILDAYAEVVAHP